MNGFVDAVQKQNCRESFRFTDASSPFVRGETEGVVQGGRAAAGRQGHVLLVRGEGPGGQAGAPGADEPERLLRHRRRRHLLDPGRTGDAKRHPGRDHPRPRAERLPGVLPGELRSVVAALRLWRAISGRIYCGHGGAAAISHARRRAGLTQTALAQRAGTSQATISAYESGRKEPSVATLSALLAAAGARLAVERAERPVLRLSESQLARAGRALQDVLALADALPTRHQPELRYPRLASGR